MATHKVIFEKETPIGSGFYVGCVQSDFTHADYDDAATSSTAAVSGFPTGAIPIGSRVKVGENVAGAGPVTAGTLAVGDAGDVDGLMVAEDVFGATEGIATGTQGAEALVDGTPATGGASMSVITTLALTGGNTEDTTAGRWTVMSYYWRLDWPTL